MSARKCRVRHFYTRFRYFLNIIKTDLRCEKKEIIF